MSQTILDKNKGHWIPAVYPVDESIVRLEVGEQFIGRYVAAKPNPTFENEVIHVFEDEAGVVRQMYGVTNLDRWMSGIDPGVMVKIVRIDDMKIGKPKPLQRYEVFLWEES